MTKFLNYLREVVMGRRGVAIAFAIVTLVYITSLRGLLAVEKTIPHGGDHPLLPLEIGATILYVAALGFTIYLYKSARYRER